MSFCWKINYVFIILNTSVLQIFFVSKFFHIKKIHKENFQIFLKKKFCYVPTVSNLFEIFFKKMNRASSVSLDIAITIPCLFIMNSEFVAILSLEEVEILFKINTN